MEEISYPIITPEIVEDMPDFEETTAEMPCEGEESVTECTDIPENENVSEETEAETEGETPDSEADTDTETEKADEKSAGTAEKKNESKPKKEGFKSNLPTGFSFNPLVIAIKPFYDKLIADDEIFANVVKERESRAEKPKSLAECAEYIISEAYNYASKHKQGNMGMAGFPDEEMYRLIRHYYDEEFLEVQKVANARVSVSTPAATTAKTAKKAEKKPAPPKNVVDITKAITAKQKTDADGKKTKREKKKDNLLAGFVPMERPDAENYEKEGKKGSREQAKSVEQMDMFADFFAGEE
ncbi:MAG: hypothetical protein IKF39_00425 [Oscillospiraceae bacterium]|nr:hypothetical protein [Oscillospiraceae bacterium]